jgi:hypothetical protein
MIPNLRTLNVSVCCVMSKEGKFYHKKQDHPFNKKNFSIFIGELLEKFNEKV